MSTKIPRLTFAELPASIATLLRPKYERLGYLGEFFARTAHQEAALKAFIEFTDAAKGSLEDNIVELIALTVATMKGVDYEKNQHERLALKLGMSREWVADVELLAPAQAARLDPTERIVQSYVIAAVERDGRDVGPLLDAVVDALGDRDAVAVMMVMGRYTTHAIIVNSLGIGPPVPSIFEEPSAARDSARVKSEEPSAARDSARVKSEEPSAARDSAREKTAGGERGSS